MFQSKIGKNRLEILTHIIIPPNLKKIHHAVFEKSTLTDRPTDRQTDRPTDGRTQTHDNRLRPIGR